MDAKELAIGNWVQYENGKAFQIGIINKTHAGAERLTTPLWHILGILLSPTILEACGWVSNSTVNGYKLWEKEIYHNYTIDFINGDIVLSSEKMDGSYYNQQLRHIQYLHQLQNLYFALTGEELEVKL